MRGERMRVTAHHLVDLARDVHDALAQEQP